MASRRALSALAAMAALAVIAPVTPANADATTSSTVVVHLTDELGQAVPDLCVRAYEAYEGGGFAWVAQACPEPGTSTVVLEGLGSDTPYLLQVDGGDAYADTWYPAAPDADTAEQVRAGAEVAVQTLRAGHLTGTLRSADGQPAGWAQVEAYPDGSQLAQGWATADETGAYALKVYPGRYRLHLSSVDIGQWAVRAVSAEDAAVYDVGPGDSLVVDDTFFAEPPHTEAIVRGTVTDAATGAPLSGICVRLGYGEDDPAARAVPRLGAVRALATSSDCLDAGGVVTGADGRYEVSVGWFDSPYAVVATAIDGQHQPARSATLHLHAGQELDVDLSMQAGGVIVGVVTDRRTGKPLRGVCPGAGVRRTGVWVADVAETCSDAKGQWRLGGLPAGEFAVTLGASDGLHQSQYLPGAKTVDSAQLVTVVPGRTVVAPASTLPRGAVLRGRIVDTAGKPVAGLDVGVGGWVDRAGGPVREGARTDADGRFTITNIEQRDDIVQVAPSRDLVGASYAWLWSGNATDPGTAKRYSFDYDKKLTFNAVVKPAASVALTVTSQPAGVEWVSVDAFNAQGSWVGFGTDVSRTHPTATLTGFSTGTVRLRFSWEDPTTGAWKVHWYGGKTLADATPIGVRAGQVTPLTLAIR